MSFPLRAGAAWIGNSGICHPREGGDPERTLESMLYYANNIAKFAKIIFWIPACAGMTSNMHYKNLIRLAITLIISLTISPCLAEINPEDDSLVVSWRVNYIDLYSFPTILYKEGAIHVPLEDIKQFKVQEDYIAPATMRIGDISYVNLSHLEGTKYQLDYENLFLEIIFPADKMQLQHLNPMEAHNADIENHPLSGLFFNYDLAFIESTNQRHLAGIQEIDYFSQYGVFSSNFLLQSDPATLTFGKRRKQQKNYNNFTRLETNWTYENIEAMSNLRIGDSITKPADWSNATRFLGVQYATNFAVRPNLITYPLLAFAGKAELPSTIDVYANSLPIYKGQAGIGDFDINNLPIITGRGELVVKTQDITGKIQTITLPYYASPILLNKGLSNFSIESGFQRKDFALKSNHYKYFVTNFDYMYGVNDRLTSGVHFETLKDFGTIGTTNNFLLGNYGVISLSLANNLKKFKNAQRFTLGYNYESINFDFNANVSKNNKDYQDIYNYPNDTPADYNYQISSGYNSPTLGSISINFLSFIIKHQQKNVRINTISTTYERNLTLNSFLRFTLGSSLKSKNRANFAYLSFGMNLDNNKNVTASTSYQDKTHTQQLNFSSPLNTPLGWGYNANLIKGRTQSYNLQLNRNGEIFDNSLYLFKYDKETTAQLGMKGAIVYMDKDVFFTRPVTNSLALVKVNNLENVGVYSNNAFVGYTNKEGNLLIPNILSYVPSEITLDDETLPLDTDFPSITLSIAPKSKTGVLVDFDVTIIKSVQLALVDEHDKFIAFDREVTIDGLADSLFIGYEGNLYINDIKNLETLKGKACGENETCCYFNIQINKTDDSPITDLGKAVCHSQVI